MGPPMERLSVRIATESIALDGLLKLSGVVGSGGRAKLLIQSGAVEVNGVTETRRKRRVSPGDVVRVEVDENMTVEIEITG